MLASSKGHSFMHTILSMHFESFSITFIKSSGHMSVESEIKAIVSLFSAELVSFKIDHHCLKMDTLSIS